MTVVSVWALQPVTGLADSSSIAVDRQAYVSDQGVDAYQAKTTAFGGTGPDSVDIHVGASGGQSTYHSFVHLELEAIPGDATVQQLTLTLHPTTDPQYAPAENLNTGQAVLDAYPLKTELAVKFDPANAPAADTTWPVVVGKLKDADGSWSFDLTPMLAYWKSHGNTGAAIVPDAVAQQPWTIGFDRTLSAVTAGFAAPAAPPVIEQAPAAAPPGLPAITDNGPGLAVAPPPAAVITQPAPTTSKRKQSHGAVANAGAGGGGSGGGPAAVPMWLMVLGVSAAASVGLLAQPVSQALGTVGGIRVGMLSQLQVHPRMFAVAAVLVVWSSSLGVYANTLGHNALGTAGGPVASGSAGNGSGDDTSTGATPSTVPSAGNGGTVAGPTQGNGAGQALTGAAAYLNSPNAPHPPAAALFGPSDNTIGITNTTVQLCAHAALTFGPAFNIGASDLNVFWQMINAQGGIWGRKVVQPGGADGISFIDDGYQPSKAVTAAQTCQDQTGGDFFLLGGIGFDQIPAVRVWAEQHHMLYVHHIATANGSQGLRYSYTMLPTLEQIGTQYGQYYVGHYSGVKIGVVYRNSSNWQPGLDAFNSYLKQAGQYGNVVDEEPVTNNQGDYSAQIAQMHNVHGANMVFIYENALAAEQFIQQSSNQGWNPQWLMFPFNLTLETLNQAKVDTSRMDGVIPWPSYTCNSSGDPRFAAYKSELQKFEAAYKQYDPGAQLCGDGGDLLFGTWLAWEQTYDLLYQCGPGCTRNNIAGLMQSGYHARRLPPWWWRRRWPRSRRRSPGSARPPRRAAARRLRRGRRTGPPQTRGRCSVAATARTA